MVWSFWYREKKIFDLMRLNKIEIIDILIKFYKYKICYLVNWMLVEIFGMMIKW